MQIDQALVHHIARLARLKVSDQEAQALESELGAIFTWIEQLNEVDTEGVSPMTRVADMEMKKRDDVVTDGEMAEEITKNAPFSDDHFFQVPKVLE